MIQLMPLYHKRMKLLSYTLLLIFFIAVTGCHSQEKIRNQATFRLIGEQEINKTVIKNTVAGGISGIDMGPDGLFYMISDDISEYGPSRFYTAVIDYDEDSLNHVKFTDVIFPKTPSGNIFPVREKLGDSEDIEVANSESVRYDAVTNSLFWTSEGLADSPVGIVQPFIRQMNLQGDFIAEISVPEQFRYLGAEGKKGLRPNSAFEALCLIPGRREILAAIEAPLIQDGGRANYYQDGAPIRLVRINLETNVQIAQYAYVPDRTPIPPIPESGESYNGITEILAIDSARILVLERSYSRGHAKGSGNSIRVYEVDLSDAPAIEGDSSLAETPFTPLEKKQVLDFAETGLKKVDNIEGMCWGKELENGNMSIVFVSDDNFSERQIFQVIVFEFRDM